MGGILPLEDRPPDLRDHIHGIINRVSINRTELLNFGGIIFIDPLKQQWPSLVDRRTSVISACHF